MELPNELWDIIVKQSKKSNYEFIKDMSIYELYELEYEIKEKRNKIYNEIKSKLNKYDIIKVTHKTDKKAYNCDLLITNLNFLKNKNKISVTNLNKSNEKCIFGNYNKGDTISFQIDLNNVDIEVISSLADRNKENIEIANSLNNGDIVIYSNYTSAEWVKYRNRYIDLSTFKNSFCYGVVQGMVLKNLIVYNFNHSSIYDNYAYPKKYMVLKKLKFEDNNELYIKLRKEHFFKSLKKDIERTNKESSVKHLINLQRKFNIKRP